MRGAGPHYAPQTFVDQRPKFDNAVRKKKKKKKKSGY
jgi:hypothetical protein